MQSTRQTTERISAPNKNNFLIKENKRLKEQLQDMKELLAMNKVQIDILSRQQYHGNQKFTPRNNQSSKLMDLIYSYRTTHEEMRKKIMQIRKQLQAKEEQNLILQQVNDQTTKQLKAIEELYQKNIKQLQQTIASLEIRACNYQRQMKQYDGLSGFVIKNRDIVNPTEQALQFRNHQLKWNDQIQEMKAKLDSSKKANQTLESANALLKHKIITLQAKLAMPNRNLGEILDKSLKRLMMYFIETQKKILAGDDSDCSDEQDLQLIAPQLHGLFPQKEIKKMKNDVHIPHLDLLKIRQSMLTSNQKIQQQLRKRNHLTPAERIQRLQIQLEYTRRQLSKNMIELREEKLMRRRLQKISEQLEGRNQALLYSNENLTVKLARCLKQIDRNRQKIINFLQSASDGTEPNSSLLGELSFINKEFNLDNVIVEHKQHKQINNSIRQISTELLGDPKLEFKIHMEMLQRDINKNTKLQHLKQLKAKQSKGQQEQQPKRLARSNSNPFLYFNERRKDIMQVQQVEDKRKIEQGFRFQQTEFLMPNMAGWMKDEDLDDIDV